jgi:hypothetical protein
MPEGVVIKAVINGSVSIPLYERELSIQASTINNAGQHQIKVQEEDSLDWR